MAGTVTFAIDDAADVLDCTYTNRARGTLIIEKVTSGGQGAFDFTSGTLTPPSWYVPTSVNPRTAVVTEGTCATATPVEFDNMPLTDINVTVNSQVDGGTASTITCDWTDPDEVGQTNAVGDGSLGQNNLTPGTYTCVIVVDP